MYRETPVRRGGRTCTAADENSRRPAALCLHGRQRASDGGNDGTDRPRRQPPTIFRGSDFGVVTKLVDPAGVPGDLFGYINVGIDDLDDDEVPDILVGVYPAATAVAPGAGKVMAFSGADRSVIRTFLDPLGFDGAEFGRGLATFPDVDGDGKTELLVGSPGTDDGAGSVLLVSGASGAILDRITDPDGAPGDAF